MWKYDEIMEEIKNTTFYIDPTKQELHPYTEIKVYSSHVRDNFYKICTVPQLLKKVKDGFTRFRITHSLAIEWEKGD